MTTTDARGPRRRWPRRLLFACAAIVVGVLAGAAVYVTSLQPGAAIVKAVFEARPEVTPPPEFAQTAARVTESDPIAVPVADAPDARMRIYAPTDAASGALPVVLWVHGGGFISSSADTVRDYAILLADAGYLVANLDYTLAPTAHYPTPVRQADAAVRYLVQHAHEIGADPDRIAIGGDSAGAQIASQVAVVETAPSFARTVGISPALAPGQLRAVVLFCGLYDMETVGATGFPALRTYLWAYTGQRDWEDYPRIGELSTTRNAGSAYPPTFLTVGDADPFESQGIELADALRGADVPVTTLLWTGTGAHLGHEYQFNFALPQARTALADTLGFLNERLSR